MAKFACLLLLFLNSTFAGAEAYARSPEWQAILLSRRMLMSNDLVERRELVAQISDLHPQGAEFVERLINMILNYDPPKGSEPLVFGSGLRRLETSATDVRYLVLQIVLNSILETPSPDVLNTKGFREILQMKLRNFRRYSSEKTHRLIQQIDGALDRMDLEKDPPELTFADRDHRLAGPLDNIRWNCPQFLLRTRVDLPTPANDR